MLLILFFVVASLLSFLLGLTFAKRIADAKIDEMRKEMELDWKEPNIWINGNWYTEEELENKVNELEFEISELKKSVDIYKTMANNAMLIRKDESEVFD